MTLRATNVSVLRQGKTLLSNITLEASPGELLVIVGPNGAGKSTLLATLAGDHPPSRGAVSLFDAALSTYSVEQLASRRAVVAAPPPLAFDYSVRDVIAMGWLHGHTGGASGLPEAMTSVLQSQGLEALADQRYMRLSSGERQRVTFARACLQLWPGLGDTRPRWWLLDEPTANLDPAHGVHLLDALRERADEGDGVIAVLHDLDLAARYADRVALLSEGELRGVGNAAEVLTGPRLTALYGTTIHTEHHPSLDRLVVIG